MNEVIELINKYGQDIEIKGRKTRELIGCKFKVPNDLEYKLDKNQKWYINKKIRTYRDAIDRVIEILKDDINSRQAVLMFKADRKSWPECVCVLNFIIRNGQLYTYIYSRSLDVKEKLNQDIEIARKISKIVGDAVGVKLKFITFFVGSAHFYY